MPELKQRLLNIFLGIYLGDAMGVPTEASTRQQILDATDGKGIDGPRYDLQIIRKVADTRGLPPGSTSDDSQLANAIADALILGDGYQREVLTLMHLKALWNDVAGWGGTTKRSLYEIDKWYRDRGRSMSTRPRPPFKSEKDHALWMDVEPRDPTHPARWREKSRGNGVAMKIAPYAAFIATRGAWSPFTTGIALRDILELSQLTHADPICAVAAYAVASVVHDLTIGLSAEYAFINMKERVFDAEVTLKLIHRGEDRFSQALRHALSLWVDPEALWQFGSTGMSDSLTSVPMALTIWHRHSEDPEPTAAVLEAINAGGDTDTVASMVGAMMGAGSGRADWWPEAWVRSLKDGGALARALSADLNAVANRRAAQHTDWDRNVLLRELGYL